MGYDYGAMREQVESGIGPDAADALDALRDMGRHTAPDRTSMGLDGIVRMGRRKQVTSGLYGRLMAQQEISPALRAKEEERQRELRAESTLQSSDEIDLIERGLCSKYHIERPAYHKNTMGRGADASPDNLLIVGQTVDDPKNSRYWGMTQEDRTMHCHILGPSGSGKSTLLQWFADNDIWMWRGGLVLEPHGDLCLNVLNAVPPYRIHDVVYLNVLDEEYSPGFNPLDIPLDATSLERSEAVSTLMSLFQKHFNMESGMVRLVKALEGALTALSYLPGATILEVMDFYNDPDIRQTALSFVPSSQAESIEAMAEGMKQDDLASLDNRISRFQQNRYLRHMFGQSKDTINFHKLMDKGAFILCPVSKGGTQDDMFLQFYGAYIVSTVYKQSMMRVGIPEKDRVIFPLTIDEFQNFITGDIGNMLAELRKYGLPMMLAHQFLAQVDNTTLAAMDNSCRTKIAYQLGTQDAPVMAKSFKVTAADMMNIPKYNVMVMPLIHKAQPDHPFITRVMPPITIKDDYASIDAELIKYYSRLRYMSERDIVEVEINERKQLFRSGNKEAIIEKYGHASTDKRD